MFPDGDTIADIGGANGAVLAQILTRLPQRHGIVFDTPPVVAAAPAYLAAAGLASRATAIGGDFFETIPLADVYVLATVLHDWDDESAVRILQNIARAARHDAKLIVIDYVVPEDGIDDAGTTSDLTMMVMVGGRERTESQWHRLLADGGFILDKITAGSGMYCAIEATLSHPHPAL
jgi:SAM-dependent methyltransferase